MFNTPEQFKNVYLHFPFCEAKCHYCDFFSLAENKTSSDQRQAIYLGIAHELQSQADHLSPKLNTVFIGGGTPSLVPLAALTKVLDLLIPRFTLSTEVTIEANPSSISREKAEQIVRIRNGRGGVPGGLTEDEAEEGVDELLYGRAGGMRGRLKIGALLGGLLSK